MSFEQSILADDAGGFLDIWGESIVYTPRGGSPRTITAVVDRMPRARMDNAGNVYRPSLTLAFKNHATTGILATDSACSGGTIAVAVRLGDTASTIAIPPGNPTMGDTGMVEVTL